MWEAGKVPVRCPLEPYAAQHEFQDSSKLVKCSYHRVGANVEAVSVCVQYVSPGSHNGLMGLCVGHQGGGADVQHHHQRLQPQQPAGVCS